MKETNENLDSLNLRSGESKAPDYSDQDIWGLKKKLYSKVNISIKTLDVFIALAVVALVVTLILGIANGNRG